MDNKKTSREEPSAVPKRPGRTLKIIISVVLLLHLTAIVSAPASSNGSPLFESFVRFFRPYLEAAYLNHGYQFFAPEPGPSHLIEYELEFDDGRPTESGVFPDLASQRPRLFYHRHFMMTEFANMLFMRSGPFGEAVADSPEDLMAAGELIGAPTTNRPPQVDPGPTVNLPPQPTPGPTVNRRDMPEDLPPAEVVPPERSLAEVYARSYAAHLLKEHDAQRVTIRLIRHFLPSAEDVRGGMKLDDPDLYADLFELRLSRDEL